MSAFVTGAKSPTRAVDGGTAGGVQVKSAVVDAGQTPAVEKNKSRIKHFEKTYLTSASLRTERMWGVFQF